uniref:Uncharacterized protein n=1 Tax=Cannabis sativa TaxID=3483 RepID=A0A803P558_CANSA
MTLQTPKHRPHSHSTTLFTVTGYRHCRSLTCRRVLRLLAVPIWALGHRRSFAQAGDLMIAERIDREEGKGAGDWCRAFGL